MYTGGDVKAGWRPLVASGRGGLRARGVNWG